MTTTPIQSLERARTTLKTLATLAIISVVGVFLVACTHDHATHGEQGAEEGASTSGEAMHTGMNHEGMNHEAVNHEVTHEGMNHEGMNREGMHPGAAAADPATAAPAGMLSVFVCANDATIGQSWAGTCPLDGSPLVERQVEASSLHDLDNAKCPILGNDARPEVFAIYKGDIMHFCCQACSGKFFETADAIIATLKADQPQD